MTARLSESLLPEGGGGDEDAWQRTSTSKMSLSRKREGNHPSARGGVEETLVSGYNASKVVVDTDMELASSMLQAVKEGRISTVTVKGGSGRNKGKKKEMKQSTNGKERQHLRAVREAEEKLAGLQAERDKLESAFWRIPGPGAKVNKSAKLAQLEKEKRLEVVRREIGLTRMMLRDNHSLNK